MKLKKMLSVMAAGALMSGSVYAGSIGYITKSATNSGWMMINQGAADAAQEAGVDLVTVGPAFQGDLSSQLEVFENLVAQGVDAIGIAPVDSSGVAPAVNDAMDAGIPVVAISCRLLCKPLIFAASSSITLLSSGLESIICAILPWPTIPEERAPVPLSAKISCISLALTCFPFTL